MGTIVTVLSALGWVATLSSEKNFATFSSLEGWYEIFKLVMCIIWTVGFYLGYCGGKQNGRLAMFYSFVVVIPVVIIFFIVFTIKGPSSMPIAKPLDQMNPGNKQ